MAKRDFAADEERIAKLQGWQLVWHRQATLLLRKAGLTSDGRPNCAELQTQRRFEAGFVRELEIGR